jgi:hypothetical protein
MSEALIKLTGLCFSDWDPVTRSYPADPDGVCRHKATWLQKYLGGTVLYGRRTDEPDSEMHAVLWLEIGGHGFIIDRDGIWHERAAPFRLRWHA